jgi:hypothetical protein
VLIAAGDVDGPVVEWGHLYFTTGLATCHPNRAETPIRVGRALGSRSPCSALVWLTVVDTGQVHDKQLA